MFDQNSTVSLPNIIIRLLFLFTYCCGLHLYMRIVNDREPYRALSEA